jgi:hypothetical protein
MDQETIDKVKEGIKAVKEACAAENIAAVDHAVEELAALIGPLVGDPPPARATGPTGGTAAGGTIGTSGTTSSTGTRT